MPRTSSRAARMTTAARLWMDQWTMACSISIVHVAAEFFGEQHLGVLRHHGVARFDTAAGCIPERVARFQDILIALPAQYTHLTPLEDAHFFPFHGLRFTRQVDERSPLVVEQGCSRHG